MTSIFNLLKRIFIILFPLLVISSLFYHLCGYELTVDLFISRFMRIDVDLFAPIIKMQNSFCSVNWSDSFNIHLAEHTPDLPAAFAWFGSVLAFFQTLGDWFSILALNIWAILVFSAEEVIEFVNLSYQLLTLFIPLDILNGTISPVEGAYISPVFGL